MSSKTIFFNHCFDKTRLKALISWCFLRFGENKTIELLEKLKEFGFYFATHGGISLSLDDLKIPKSKSQLISQADFEIKKAQGDWQAGNLTVVEKFQQIIDTWHRTSETLRQDVIRNFRTQESLNPLSMMAFSGARGNISQVRQLVGMRGLMSDPQGQIIDFPIRSNFREGLTLIEYVISCYGARKGVVDTALRTANSGYLTRRLVDVAHHVVVSQFDCGTYRGTLIKQTKDRTKVILSFEDRLVGRVLAEKIDFPNGEIVNRNQDICHSLARKIAKYKKHVWVRSPLTCQAKQFICQLCYGWSLAHGNIVSLGEAVGILAAQSIGEPGTQLTMRTFHTGGVFSGDVMNEIRAPFDGRVCFPEPLEGQLIRTPHGKIAFLTKMDGTFFITQASTEGRVQPHESKFFIPSGTLLFVRQNQKILEKQLLVEYSSIATKSNQRVQSQHKLNSSQEGEIFFEKVMLSVPKNNESIVFASKLSCFWILSGKICSSPKITSTFPKSGDLIEKSSLWSESILISPVQGFLEVHLYEGTKSFVTSEGTREKQDFQSKKLVLEKLSSNSFSSRTNVFQGYRYKRVLRPYLLDFAKKNGQITPDGSTENTQTKLHKKVFLCQSCLSLSISLIQYNKFGYFLSYPFFSNEKILLSLSLINAKQDNKFWTTTKENSFFMRWFPKVSEIQAGKILSDLEVFFDFRNQEGLLFLIPEKNIFYPRRDLILNFLVNNKRLIYGANWGCNSHSVSERKSAFDFYSNSSPVEKCIFQPNLNFHINQQGFLEKIKWEDNSLVKIRTNLAQKSFQKQLIGWSKSKIQKSKKVQTGFLILTSQDSCPTNQKVFRIFVNPLPKKNVQNTIYLGLNFSRDFIKNPCEHLKKPVHKTSYNGHPFGLYPLALPVGKSQKRCASFGQKLKRSVLLPIIQKLVGQLPFFKICCQSNDFFNFSLIWELRTRQKLLQLNKINKLHIELENKKRILFDQVFKSNNIGKHQLATIRKILFSKKLEKQTQFTAKVGWIYLPKSEFDYTGKHFKIHNQLVQRGKFSIDDIVFDQCSVYTEFFNNYFVEKHDIRRNQKSSRRPSSKFSQQLKPGFSVRLLGSKTPFQPKKNDSLNNFQVKPNHHFGYSEMSGTETKNTSIFISSCSKVKGLKYPTKFAFGQRQDYWYSLHNLIGNKNFSQLPVFDVKTRQKKFFGYFVFSSEQFSLVEFYFEPYKTQVAGSAVQPKNTNYKNYFVSNLKQNNLIQFIDNNEFSWSSMTQFSFSLKKKNLAVWTKIITKVKVEDSMFSTIDKQAFEITQRSKVKDRKLWFQKSFFNDQLPLNTIDDLSSNVENVFLLKLKSIDFFDFISERERKLNTFFSEKPVSARVEGALSNQKCNQKISFYSRYFLKKNQEMFFSQTKKSKFKLQLDNLDFVDHQGRGTELQNGIFEKTYSDNIKCYQKNQKKFYHLFRKLDEYYIPPKEFFKNKLSKLYLSNSLNIFKHENLFNEFSIYLPHFNKQHKTEIWNSVTKKMIPSFYFKFEAFFSYQLFKKSFNQKTYLLHFVLSSTILKNASFQKSIFRINKKSLFVVQPKLNSEFKLFNFDKEKNYKTSFCSNIKASTSTETEYSYCLEKYLKQVKKLPTRLPLALQPSVLSFTKPKSKLIKISKILKGIVFYPILEYLVQKEIQLETATEFCFDKRKSNFLTGQKRPAPQYDIKFLIYRSNAILAHDPVILESFLSPYEGEMIPKNFDAGEKSLILTISNQKSFFLEKNIQWLPDGRHLVVGKMLRFGEGIANDTIISCSGQVLELEKQKIILRCAQPFLGSSKSVFHVTHGEFIEKDTPLLTLFYQRLKTGDIVQGIPKIEELFEARQTKQGEILENNVHKQLKKFFYLSKTVFPTKEAVRQSFDKIRQILVQEIQQVYQSQGVSISEKHIEIIVRQMTSKVRVLDGGQTGLLPDEFVDLRWIEIVNSGLETKKAEYEPIVFGITKSALEAGSFISAASFQETTRVLTRAAIERKTDFLRGLKENVILGRLIPAGTGFSLIFKPEKNFFDGTKNPIKKKMKSIKN